MGNSSTKESPHQGSPPQGPTLQHRRPSSFMPGGSEQTVGARTTPHSSSPDARRGLTISGGGDGRSNLPFFSISGSSGVGAGSSALEPRRETRQEREARRAERDRIAREKERERSMKEESVDGGYLVTQGVYIGPEDFSKAVVRQLMVSRPHFTLSFKSILLSLIICAD